VAGLDTVMFAGLMESIEWFFHLVRQGSMMPPMALLNHLRGYSTTRTRTVS
jgi:hypothetical protein